MHQTELFGPVLAVIKAEDLNDALEIANDTAYGLTAGFHSLDEKEQEIWINKMEAGNLYINRGTTGAIVRRQPFGGCKESCFGHGAKAGGPNYVSQFAKVEQVALPEHRSNPKDGIAQLLKDSTRMEISPEDLGVYLASIASYTFWAKKYKEKEDPSKIVGQDNFFYYVPRKKIALRIQKEDSPLDVIRILVACQLVQAPLFCSYDPMEVKIHFGDELKKQLSMHQFVGEGEAQFLKRLEEREFSRVRMISHPKDKFYMQAAKTGAYILARPVLANGRFELLHYLQEVALSADYHRYGNLGIREGEIRKPIL
jgi:RHH-type proline utilization regulon transcriptional repressor/proline dehydrogenase/delta 1-pyrroline-5-carboxylate dehydrogenase